MEKHRINPRWSCVPAGILFFMWLPGMNFASLGGYLHIGGTVLWGLLASLAYIYVFNRIETGKHQYIFLALSLLALPFIGYGLLMGGLLGAVGIIINTGIPLLLLLLFGGGALYKRERVVTRSVVSLVLFLLIVSFGVRLLMQSSQKGMERVCADIHLGVWNEAEERCDVSPEQEVRNIIFLSDGSITLEGGRIFFDHPDEYDTPPHGERGDMTAYLSVGDDEESTVRFRADFALYDSDASVVYVPLLSEASGNLHIASLRKVDGGALISRSDSISVVNLGRGDITGWGFDNPEETVLSVQVTRDGEEEVVLLNVSPDGVLTQQ